MALPTLFDPARADGLEATVELRVGAEAFRVTVRDGALDVSRGPADDPDAVVEGGPEDLARALWRGDGPGALRIQGDRRVAERVLGLFPLPGGDQGRQ